MPRRIVGREELECGTVIGVTTPKNVEEPVDVTLRTPVLLDVFS